MEADIEDIADSVRELEISYGAPQDRRQESLRSTYRHPVSLQSAIHMLIESAETTISQAQFTRSLADDTNSFPRLSITEACSLQKASKTLTELTSSLQSTIDTLNQATENSVIIHLTSLGSPSSPIIPKLLSHFDKEIKAIVRTIIDNSSDLDVLWKVAEECYNQVFSSSGNLNADDYFDSLEDACPEWPYDPDFESEEYYEHENRLIVDEYYSVAFQEKSINRFEARRKDRQSWSEFWFRVLNNSPAGPTLFNPKKSGVSRYLYSDSIPPYLFRTFDKSSSGRNNERIIASVASITGSQEISRTDILEMEMRETTKLLCTHLKKGCFGAEKSDNLMSWTSSLLFAIQYAFYRLRNGPCNMSEIKICAVDTRNFPQGQFAQDTWLLNAYNEVANRMGGIEENFINFRLNNEDYYNGEYLSQGVVNHTDRSCVVSLEHLIQAGLFQLYPEFEDPRGHKEWTNRVWVLRKNWLAEQNTTDQEIQLSLKIARNCFPRYNPIDIASIFLTFKNRKGLNITPKGNSNQCEKRQPRWADKPVEVRRYWISRETASAHNNAHDAWFNRLFLQHDKTLRMIFN